MCIRVRYLYSFLVCVYVFGMRSKSASFFPLRAKMTPPSFKRICPPVRYLNTPIAERCRACRRRSKRFEKTRSWIFEHVQMPKSVKMHQNVCFNVICYFLCLALNQVGVQEHMFSEPVSASRLSGTDKKWTLPRLSLSSRNVS